jgi:hypothetical protein
MTSEPVVARRASTILAGFLNGMKTERNLPFLLPANCCPILPATFQLVDWPYELVDIDPEHLGLPSEAVLDRVRRGGVGGVLWVSAYGHIWKGLQEFSTRLKELDSAVLLVDDRCLARPSLEPRNPLADLEIYSSGYSKFVDLGEGGWGFLRDIGICRPLGGEYLSTSHDELVAEFRSAACGGKSFRMPNRTWLDERPASKPWSEYSSLLAEKALQATEHRLRIAEIYRNTLPRTIQLEPRCDDWRVNICVDRPALLLESLSLRGLFASRHYPCLAPAFGTAGAPNAERLAGRVVNLFNDFRFSEEMARTACETILEHLDRYP